MTMSNSLLRLIAVFVGYALGCAPVCAADIRAESSAGATGALVLEGQIVRGDFDKFKKIVLTTGSSGDLYLASPGGDMVEAMRMGFLVRLLKLSTIVPGKALTNQVRDLTAARYHLQNPKANYECTSACFFIFVAGVHRSHDEIGSPLLGIHRPTLTRESLQRLRPDQADASNERTRATVERYLKVMGVPAHYADDMYAEPPGKIQWIRNDEFETDFQGFIPEEKIWIDARCDNFTAAEDKIWQERDNAAQSEAERSGIDELTRKRGEQLKCKEEARTEMALKAYEEVQKKPDSARPGWMQDAAPSVPTK
jgi:hypothetical protein